MELTNFWIELKETQGGLKMLSAKIEGKHWVGFLETRDGKRDNGETYQFTTANMKPCSWEKCNICYPNVII